MDQGTLFSALQEYGDGKLSLGQFAETLEITTLEALQLIARYKVYPHIPEEYLTDARQTARSLLPGPTHLGCRRTDF